MESKREAAFDSFAEDYQGALQQGLAVSGESAEFFARSRIAWLERCLDELRCEAGSLLDFGCGTGAATPFLLALPGARSLLGVDVSARSVAVAERTHGSANARFRLLPDAGPRGDVDVAYCNGVLHHITPAQRPEALRQVFAHLRPGGIFSLWENNPWNPGTRWVMSRIPFDRDATPLPYTESRQRLHAAGFEILRIDFHFIFPHALRLLRPLEAAVRRLPLGAQYHILARRPAHGTQRRIDGDGGQDHP